MWNNSTASRYNTRPEINLFLLTTTAHSLSFLIGHALVWQNTCVIILQCSKCQNQEALIWAQRPLSVCQDQSEYLLLINHNAIPVICCGNANQNILQQNKCEKKSRFRVTWGIAIPFLRNSPIIHSPSHRWKRTSLSVQFSVCGLNLMQLAENGQMFPAWHSRGACAALPADSRSSWLASRDCMKYRTEITSGWGYFLPGAWSVCSGLKSEVTDVELVFNTIKLVGWYEPRLLTCLWLLDHQYWFPPRLCFFPSTLLPLN